MHRHKFYELEIMSVQSSYSLPMIRTVQYYPLHLPNAINMCNGHFVGMLITSIDLHWRK